MAAPPGITPVFHTVMPPLTPHSYGAPSNRENALKKHISKQLPGSTRAVTFIDPKDSSHFLVTIVLQ